MNNAQGFGFVGGFVLGGIVGATIALMLAPASGVETRDQIRAEGIALKQRGEQLGDARIGQVQKMVKQGKKGISDAQTRLGKVMDDQKGNLREAIGMAS